MTTKGEFGEPFIYHHGTYRSSRGHVQFNRIESENGAVARMYVNDLTDENAERLVACGNALAGVKHPEQLRAFLEASVMLRGFAVYENAQSGPVADWLAAYDAFTGEGAGR